MFTAHLLPQHIVYFPSVISSVISVELCHRDVAKPSWVVLFLTLRKHFTHVSSAGGSPNYTVEASRALQSGVRGHRWSLQSWLGTQLAFHFTAGLSNCIIVSETAEGLCSESLRDNTWLLAIIPCPKYACGLAPVAGMPVMIDAFHLGWD